MGSKDQVHPRDVSSTSSMASLPILFMDVSQAPRRVPNMLQGLNKHLGNGLNENGAKLILCTIKCHQI